MSVEHNLPLVRARKQSLAKGDPDRCAEQKKLNKLTARERIDLLFDASSFVELDALVGRDGKAGVVTGYGTVDDRPVYVYAQDYTAMGGAVGADHAKKIVKVLDLAMKTGAPVVAMFDSLGARLLEGIDAVNAYAAIAAKTSALSGVVPQIALVMGQCAGTAATIAAMSDVVIASEAARLFVNGPQVVSANTATTVDAQTLGGAQALKDNGIAHLAAKTDAEAIALARLVAGLLPDNNLQDAPSVGMADDVNREIPDFEALTGSVDALSALANIADAGSVLELSEAYAPEMITALGRVGGNAVGFVATQPTKDAGAMTAKGCRKAARFVRMCDCFNIPVVTLVDTVGFSVACASGQGDLARAAAQLSFALNETTSPRVALVLGKAIGAGYMALASRAAADMAYAWPGAVIAPLDTAAAVQALMSDALAAGGDAAKKRAELEEKYQDNIADGVNAAILGYVDDVIEPAQTRMLLFAALEMLSSKRDTRAARKHGNLPL